MRGGNQYLHKVVDTLDSSWRGRGIESEACGGLGRLLRRGTREGPRDVVGKGRADDGRYVDGPNFLGTHRVLVGCGGIGP